VPPAPAFQSFSNKRDVTGRVTNVSTGPRKKPTKAAGKQQQTSVQTTRASPQNGSSILCPFGQRLRALRERYLGPPLGEPGSDGRLQDETSKCESLTKRAILDAHDTEKLAVFGTGFGGLQESMCSAAVACYSDCFKLVEENRSECDAPPAEFASSFTADCLSTFLRVTALDGAEEAREIDSNGRVRWFVRHACGDWSDVYPIKDGLPGQSAAFRLPQWFSWVWMARAKLAKRRWPNDYMVVPPTDPLSIEETEKFILEKQQMLIKELRDAVADAHREALIDSGKSVTATTAPQRVAKRERTQTEKPQLRRFSSKVREAIAYCIRTKQNSSDQEIFAYLRENHPKLIPPSWAQDQKLAADTFTKVRRVLRGEGQKRVNRHLPDTSEKVPVR
jgi:hypothetical protein